MIGDMICSEGGSLGGSLGHSRFGLRGSHNGSTFIADPRTIPSMCVVAMVVMLTIDHFIISNPK